MGYGQMRMPPEKMMTRLSCVLVHLGVYNYSPTQSAPNTLLTTTIAHTPPSPQPCMNLTEPETSALCFIAPPSPPPPPPQSGLVTRQGIRQVMGRAIRGIISPAIHNPQQVDKTSPDQDTPARNTHNTSICKPI